MVRSLQNIALAMVIVSAISLCSSLIVNVVNCPAAAGCLAAADFYKLNYDQNFQTHESTEKTAPQKPEVSFNEVAKDTQVVSTYALAAAVTVMIALEAFELRYLKIFLTAKKRRPTRRVN